MGLGLGVSMQTLCQQLAACFFPGILAVGRVGSATMPCGWRMRDIVGPVPIPCDEGPGYTFGMKTAISLPDDVFGEAEGLAAQLRISRSELYGRALKEFLARHAPNQVTQALDTLCDDLDTRPDGFVVRSARRVLGDSKW
jgi:hypothetical protein